MNTCMAANASVMFQLTTTLYEISIITISVNCQVTVREITHIIEIREYS